MNESLATEAKKFGYLIIELSTKHASNMQSWAELDTRPNNFSVTECVGFKSRDEDALQLITDLINPNNDQAVMRLWGIVSHIDSQGNELFNNIQLNFTVDKEQASRVTQKANNATRDDLKYLLNLDSTGLERLIVSDESGRNEETGEVFGTRFDIKDDSTELINEREVIESLQNASLKF